MIARLSQEDATALQDCARAGDDFPAHLERALATWPQESRELAVQALVVNNTRGAPAVLLSLTKDREPQVAVAAAQALSKVIPLPPKEILDALPSRSEPVVRSTLYRWVGTHGKAHDLADLRLRLLAEQDLETAEEGQAAAVRLGGEPERARFKQRVAEAEPDTAVRTCDQLVYIGQKPLAKALIPWLANRSEVMRLGSDRMIKMARMCDLAVWTSLELGVQMSPKPDRLDVYPQTLLASAHTALVALPD